MSVAIFPFRCAGPRRQRSLSTRSTRSTCRALFNPAQALAEMLIIRFQSRQWADPPAASSRCYIHPPARRRYQIPIAPAAPPVPNFPPLRALALFGRRPPQRVEEVVMPSSKKLHTSGLMQCGKLYSYSITTSARASRGAGTSRPSALAVLRLMTNSNFVDWITGRSAAWHL